jgi:transcriptional regulator with XRE-family HTH domain
VRERHRCGQLCNNAILFEASKATRRTAYAAVSQFELGVALGVSAQQIQKYERGRNSIAARLLLQITQVLAKVARAMRS